MIEYRIMVAIWILTIVLPLIMLAAWLSIAEKGPVGGLRSDKLHLLLPRRPRGTQHDRHVVHLGDG